MLRRRYFCAGQERTQPRDHLTLADTQWIDGSAAVALHSLPVTFEVLDSAIANDVDNQHAVLTAELAAKGSHTLVRFPTLGWGERFVLDGPNLMARIDLAGFTDLVFLGEPRQTRLCHDTRFTVETDPRFFFPADDTVTFPTVGFIGTWDSGTAYVKGNIVYYTGAQGLKSYLSRTSNTNKQPDLNTADWFVLKSNRQLFRTSVTSSDIHWFNLAYEGTNYSVDAAGYAQRASDYEPEHGWRILDSHNHLISHCTMSRFDGDGVSSDGAVGAPAADIEIDACRAVQHGRHAFASQNAVRVLIRLCSNYRGRDVFVSAEANAITGQGEHCEDWEIAQCVTDARVIPFSVAGNNRSSRFWFHHNTAATQPAAESSFAPWRFLALDSAQRSDDCLIEHETLLYNPGTAGFCVQFSKVNNAKVRFCNFLGKTHAAKANVQFDTCDGVLEVIGVVGGNGPSSAISGLVEVAGGTAIAQVVHHGNTWDTGGAD